MTERFRLVAWNIRAGGGGRAPQISRALAALQPDAVILSEFRATPPSQNIAAALRADGLLHQRTSVGEVGPGANALLIAARQPLRRVPLRTFPNEPGRWHIVRLATPRLTLAGMHIPNQHTGRKPGYHHAVLALARRWRGGACILAGDTNSGRIGEDEQTPVFNQATHNWFDELHSAGWRDSYRLVHGARPAFTWYSPGHDNGFRLDQAFVSPLLRTRVVDVQHLWVPDARQAGRRDAVSDHAALIVDLDGRDL